MQLGKSMTVGLVVVAQGAFIGCRAARGPQGMLPSGAVADFTRAYTGQMRFLPGYGESARINLAQGAALKKDGCDVAVLVRSATLEGGTARFVLEPVGLPNIDVQRAERACSKPPYEYVLSISDLEAGAPLERLSEEIDRVLSTPERYLKDRGVEFDRPAADKLGPIADKRLHTAYKERSLARAVTKTYRRLLSVVPLKRERHKKLHYQGEVSFVAVVGTDGRLHDAKLLGSYGIHEDLILKVLGLWRYEPAFKDAEPVAYRTEERTRLRVY
jgi:hypothetical protein